jgi:hypothetical protein
MGNAPAQARLSAIRITEMVSSRFTVALRSCYLNPAAPPIPAASITIIAADGHQLLRTTTTERHGRYAASGLPEGLLTVLVSAVGALPQIDQQVPGLLLGPAPRPDKRSHPGHEHGECSPGSRTNT